MGNMQAESNCVSFRLQGDYNYPFERSRSYTSQVDGNQISRDDFVYHGPGGGGYGLCQWTFWSRKAGLYDLAKNPNKKPGVGFVLGTRKLTILNSVLVENEDYDIEVKSLFCDDSIASFECIMYNERKNEEVANAIINAYRPDNIDIFMKEYT